MHQIYSANPNFGITSETIKHNASSSSSEEEQKERERLEMNQLLSDDVNIIDSPEQRNDVLSVYCAEGAKLADREPVYNAELGLAIERLRDDFTIEQLWNIV